MHFHRILCPVDFFPTSLRAFRCACSLAAKYKASLHLLHAIPPVITAAYGASITAGDIVSDLQKDAKGRLQQLKTEGEASKVSVTTEVRLGDVDSLIRRAIKSRRPDLLIMGTHGRRGLERWVIGSVAERAIRHCPVPLLVIGRRGSGPVESFGFQRILVTTDFSEGTGAALANALSIAKEHRSSVTLLHVVGDVTADLGGKYRSSLLKGVEDQLDALAKRAGKNNRNVKVQVATGRASRVIPGIVKKGRHDLLIMNIHGKTLVERALIGSTAERVVRAVVGNCPVLLIPPAASRRG